MLGRGVVRASHPLGVSYTAVLLVGFNTLKRSDCNLMIMIAYIFNSRVPAGSAIAAFIILQWGWAYVRVNRYGLIMYC